MLGLSQVRLDKPVTNPLTWVGNPELQASLHAGIWSGNVLYQKEQTALVALSADQVPVISVEQASCA